MIVKFPATGPVVETNLSDRKYLRRAEEKLRYAAIVPGNEKLSAAADAIREFVDEQERDEQPEG